MEKGLRLVYFGPMDRVRRLFADHRRTVFDVLPALAVLALAAVEVATVSELGRARGLVAAGAVLMTIPLFWRRRWPLAVTLVVIAGLILVGDGADNTTFPMGSMLVVAYAGGAYADTRNAALSLGALLGFLAVALVLIDDTPADFVFLAVILGAVWIAGRGIRSRQQRAEVLADRATLLEHERDAKARAAVAEERVRIARELHDVVAHGISVMVLQARGGRRMVGSEPAEAEGAFDSIEATGREALGEMRRLLGMLRQDDEELALAPQPSMQHLDALVERVRAAGLPVELSVEGEPPELSPGVDLSAYRIVQEALTNALKHAGPARARVTVRYRRDELELEIADDGTGPATNGDSPGGHGLAGMRERVEMFGGDLRAASPDDGGFALRARLPIDR
jgi:signal transduction histidine kinase